MSSTPSSPDAVKSTGERALAAIPVALTILATVLAGLSSSEMTQSMYYRSLAAQNQSKAGSQWAFFQAKRIRGTTMESGGDLVRAVADPPPIDVAHLRSIGAPSGGAIRQVGNTEGGTAADRLQRAREKFQTVLNGPTIVSSLRYLSGQDLPPVAEKHTSEPQIQDLLKAIENRQTEVQTADRILQVSTAKLDEAIELSEANAAAFDDACKPVTNDIRSIERACADLAAEVRKAGPDGASRDVKDTLSGIRMARQDLTARRYAKEAAYNQESAELYELLCRRNGAESDRHRHRSKNFFYAMLCAQAGVTIASLALAQSRKSWFWGIASAAGLIAVSFGAYVYLAL
jgi:hypothetical protein